MLGNIQTKTQGQIKKIQCLTSTLMCATIVGERTLRVIIKWASQHCDAHFDIRRGNIMINHEQITISGGDIDGISDGTTIKVSPLTILVGGQGSGTTFLNKIIYALRDAHYLTVSKFTVDDGVDTAKTVQRCINNLYHRGTSVTSLIKGNSLIRVQYDFQQEGEESQSRTISLSGNTGKISPLNTFKNAVQTWIKVLNEPFSPNPISIPKAVFFPADRLFYSNFINVSIMILSHSTLPIGTTTCRDFLMKAGQIHSKYINDNGDYPNEVDQIHGLTSPIFGGYPVAKKRRVGVCWKWKNNEGKESDIENVSPGQASVWPIIAIAQALITLRSQDDSEIPFIHIEEPEAHLSPKEQVTMAHLLVYLVNQGFRLVVTTHSKIILNALNESMMMYEKHQDKTIPNSGLVSGLRLRRDDLSVYFFEDGKAKSVVTDTQISIPETW